MQLTLVNEESESWTSPASPRTCPRQITTAYDVVHSLFEHDDGRGLIVAERVTRPYQLECDQGGLPFG